MLPEEEAVIDFDKTVLVWVKVRDLVQYFGFNLSIFCIVSPLLTNLDCNYSTIFRHVSTSKYLAKRTLSHDFVDYVTVGELLALLTIVAPIFGTECAPIAHSDTADGVYLCTMQDLCLLKLCQLVCIMNQCLGRRHPIQRRIGAGACRVQRRQS